MNVSELNNNITLKSKLIIEYFSSRKYLVFILLLVLKILLQVSLFQNGYNWLSADDFCRTVKSFEWMQKPEIHSGVWLSGHFWVNGLAMLFIKNLFVTATAVNFLFSALTLFYFYNVIDICFDKKIAFFSSLIFCVFPFQVWLSISGLPESIFFFFVIAGIYYFIKWKISNDKLVFLILSAVAFALSNLFRYEGWLFSVVFVFLVILDVKKEKKLNKEITKNILISLLSFSTIIFWLVLNYIDYKDVFFFAKETNKIYEDYNTVKYLQRLIQYPTFLFYIAPITTVLSVKVIWDFSRSVFKSNGEFSKIAIYFAMFNIVELILLMLQGLTGTGGTNMISRYIVINALLFLPFAIYQVFKYRKVLTIVFLTTIILVNFIWCYYFPQSFRADTVETGRLLKNQIEKKIGKDDKIYFEEIEGYYDVFAVQTLSNNPSKFVLGNFPSLKIEEKKSKKKNRLSDEELNILDIKSFFEKNKISIAVVKSDSYVDKLRKMNFKNEEIGEYKIFYLKNIESNLNDSSISIFTQNVPSLEKNSGLINFNKIIALKDIRIDNSNFGFNPQTITLEWSAVNKNILDSIDYENYDFDRYNAVININSIDNDSVVYSESKRIFSDRNIEDLIFYNYVKNIIVLKPFAVIFYSKRMSNYSFESGVYNLSLKVFDSKANKDLALFKGNSRYHYEDVNPKDTSGGKGSDTLKIKLKDPITKKDTILYSYNLGNIIAMFPNTNVEKLVKKTNVNFYRIITQNGLQVFFSQRYQGDNFLNFVFNYF
ncbi:MAG: glycosyltransferase family 39 protein [Ignavibacteriae bacterium]|nr:glycosyltransferase family 39 protein [Ignavibacteriota bacterium]